MMPKTVIVPMKSMKPTIPIVSMASLASKGQGHVKDSNISLGYNYTNVTNDSV